MDQSLHITADACYCPISILMPMQFSIRSSLVAPNKTLHALPKITMRIVFPQIILTNPTGPWTVLSVVMKSGCVARIAYWSSFLVLILILLVLIIVSLLTYRYATETSATSLFSRLSALCTFSQML